MEDLFIKINTIRKAASRFYTVDLHVHSPISYDWKNSGSEANPRNPNLDRIPPGAAIPPESVADYCRAVQGSKRELIAITDHNRSIFGVTAAKNNDRADLCVLPGIELSVTFSSTPLIRELRVHVLAIFPESTHHEAIARIFPPGTPAEDTRNPQVTHSYGSVDQLVGCIHKEGGLAIAAHIESANGLRGVYKNTIELLIEPIGGSPEAQEVLKRLGDQVKDELVKFDAIQVTPATDAIHYMGPNGDLRVPLIVASDCHEGKSLKEEQPSKYSYIKMARPSFASLFDALKFPDLRVRFLPSLPTAEPPRILGLRIVGHKSTSNTFFDDVVLGYSDNLTCLIGPRGSGKSAIIDGLRYLMGYNRNLSQIPKAADQVVDRQRHTLQKSRIEALYQSADGRIYKLLATYDPQEVYVTEVYDLEGNKLGIEDIATSGEFPLNLFGWGELELLAENPDTQRELLDRFIPDLAGLKDEKIDIIGRLNQNRKIIVQEAGKMSLFFSDPEMDFRRVDEFKRKYDELNTPEIEAVFTKLDSLRNKRSVLKSMRKLLQQRIQDGDIAPALELSKYLEEESLKEWTEGLLARLKPDEIDDWMREINRQHQSKVQIALDIVNAEDDKITRQEENAEHEIHAAIGEEQAITGDLRNRAKSRYENADANFAKYKEHRGLLDDLLREREKLLDKLDDCDKRIFATRNKEIRRIGDQVSLVEDENYKIDLVLNQQTDRGIYQDRLSSGTVIQFHGHWKAGKHCEIISENLTPRGLASLILSYDFDALDDLSIQMDGNDYTLTHKQIERIVTENKPFSKVENVDTVRVNTEKLDRILKIQQTPTDDNFFITLGGKSIQHCSPGQRCSAMLPIVALTSQAPLVIDQPEDNLDNRLVSRALFKILARLKEKRQLIMATHNPNILVSGDAEQVLLLNAEGNIERYGSIDDPKIVDAVLRLMEGGAEAFNRRHTKYEPLLG